VGQSVASGLAAGTMAKKGEKKGITIIRREEVVEAAHHGGAWKVAYADFVTAMMAFFLLMWLLNATTEKQRRGLADYFSPTLATANSRSGSGMPLAGKSPFEDGEAVSDKGAIAAINGHAPPADVDDDDSDTVVTRTVHSQATDDEGADGGRPEGGRADGKAGHGGKSPADITATQKAAALARQQEQSAFAQAAATMQQLVAADPTLAPLAKQLSIDLTPQGLRVQIRDEDKHPMFATGSAEPNDATRALLARLMPVLAKLQEPISISGFTDGAPYNGKGRTNWDLSTERANATRRLLLEEGLPDGRIKDVVGHADRDLLLPADPLASANRRIAITLLRTAPGH
jgi:chemotaxis protein MotB